MLPLYQLRAGRPADYDFLWSLKQQTMRAYVEQTWGRWDEAVQLEWFRRDFVPAVLRIIVVDGRDAGLLNATRHPAEIFLGQIEILPELQGRGLGTAVIRDLQVEAETARLPLRLQVLKVNAAAQRLYARLGFTVTSETAAHRLMFWSPLTSSRSGRGT